MMCNLFSRLFILIILLSSCTTANAQPQAIDSIKVSFITCYAGSDIYELCGHSAIRIQYAGDDVAVNYGMFDFNAPNFVYRFVKGETDYMVGVYPFDSFVNSYARNGRKIVEQELNLTQAQASRLIELIEINLRPENRVYRYNYVKDNCATRPVAIIEKAIGDTISLSTPTINTEGWSYRDEMRYFHKNYPWYQFGIDLALGSGIDYTISNREKGFAPEILEQLLAGATISSTNGEQIPLVKSTTIVFKGTPGGAQLPPTPWILSPIAIFSILLIVIAWISWRDIKRGKTTRWIDTILFGTFGLLGLLMTFLIFVSVHEATSPNWLYLWLNPLCFIPAIGLWLKKCKRMVLYYYFANFVALFLLAIALVITGQSINIAFVPLILCNLVRSASYIYINKCVVKKTI
ncbi:MAG: DUF4105 domain-containing protein [Muribaculaceae bacterium]|nr:DUF4105 domain-containing protein [Muribaculaceae bacterium]